MEVSSQWGFRAFNSPFCTRSAVMGFLNNPCLGNCIKEETQEVIPYTLPPTNLLISLLHPSFTRPLGFLSNKTQARFFDQ